MTAANSPTRFWSLDYLRGLCAISVLGSHVALWVDFVPGNAVERLIASAVSWAYAAFTWAFWPTGAHHPGVGCFFVLSGFCVHWQFARRVAGEPPHWGAYYLRRIRRIMPVYWVATLLGLALVLAERTKPTGNPFLAMHTAGNDGDLLARVLGITSVWPREVFLGNMPLGTIGTELAIYLFYPLFFALAVRQRWVMLGLAILSMQVLALALEPHVNPFVLFPGPLVMAWLWFLGALAARFVAERRTAVRGWWIGAAWLLFQAVKALPRFYGQSLLKQIVFGGACALLVVWLVNWQSRQPVESRAPWARFLGWAGDVSYSLYAVHTPAMLFATWALVTVGALNYTLQLICALALTLGLTWVMHRGIERRFYSATPAVR